MASARDLPMPFSSLARVGASALLISTGPAQANTGIRLAMSACRARRETRGSRVETVMRVLLERCGVLPCGSIAAAVVTSCDSGRVKPSPLAGGFVQKCSADQERRPALDVQDAR